jgi:hypothetical protein
MTYKDLIETIEIIKKYDESSNCYSIWAQHEEIGFTFEYEWNVSAKDIRRLAEMGWSLAGDELYDEDDDRFEKWENYKNVSDEELMKIFKDFNSISIFV